MGAIFKLEHANIMAYITSRSCSTPCVLREHLGGFLGALSDNSKRLLISEFRPGALNWRFKVAEIANRALNQLQEITYESETDIVFPSTVERVLESLRTEFSYFPLYALAVGFDRQTDEVARKAARTGMYSQLLVLIPEHLHSGRKLELLDPMPAYSAAIHSFAEWPGLLFWTQTGTTAFARVDEVEELLEKLAQTDRRSSPYEFLSGNEFDYVLREWTKTRKESFKSQKRRLLHLSDLHLGTRIAAQNREFLEVELSEVVSKVDRVVITGDIFDSSRVYESHLFTSLVSTITQLSQGREPVCIPGNHDQRLMGIIGDDYRNVSLIGSPRIVIDDQCRVIFVCFNSSEEGQFARGFIPREQFLQLGARFSAHKNLRPELKRYLPIVLVHHHPFSFDAERQSMVQRVLSMVRISEEPLLKMINAEELHEWCMSWDIKTILHGHKHEARYMTKEIEGNSETMLLTAIGCGSTLGAGGSPMSYNILEWDANTQMWVASFFESSNGGAFRERAISLSSC